jgi:hypothetical protein
MPAVSPFLVSLVFLVLASKMPELSYRAAMLPYGEDAQGHGHWAVPGMIYGPAMAAARLFGQGGFWNGPQDPQAASDMRDVLYSIYGGNALADAGRAAELAAVRTNPAVAARVYRGSPIGETWAPEGALRNTTYWASDNPEVANTYARVRGDGPNVMPADVSFKNPLVVDAGGREWTGIPWGSRKVATDTLANLARTFGHDGLVVRNVRDMIEGGPLATTYAALRPGTVFSPLTGEQLYANGSGLPGLLGVPSNAQQGRAPR